MKNSHFIENRRAGFAAKAMQGMLASCNGVASDMASVGLITSASVANADALMAQLAKEEAGESEEDRAQRISTCGTVYRMTEGRL